MCGIIARNKTALGICGWLVRQPKFIGDANWKQIVSIGVKSPHAQNPVDGRTDGASLVKSPDLQQLLLGSKRRGRTFPGYWSFAYSALAAFRMGMSGSASFQRVTKSRYALRALTVSPWMA
jgi:hypothetical protein